MSYPTILNRLPEIAFALLPRVNFPDDIVSRHFAFLLDKSKIINIGWNSYKSHSETVKRGYPIYTKGLHAELSCIISCKSHTYKNRSMAVLRINWNNKLDYSRPCPHCMEAIKELGIKNIWYTTKTGWEKE
jgi:deoxycytidylate deaminase